MSLTHFVGLPQVKERFKSEFRPAFIENNRSLDLILKMNASEKTAKQIIGINFEVSEGKIIRICDSSGRFKEIGCIEDLISFFIYEKYRNNICVFYDTNFDITKIANHFNDPERDELIRTGKTRYWVYSIQHSGITFFQVGRKSNYYKFYNFFSLLKAPLSQVRVDKATDTENDVASIFDRKKINRSTSDEISSTRCLRTAIIIQKLAFDMQQKFVEERAPDIKGKVALPPRTSNNNVVGTAFDYLFRFLIKAHNPEAVDSHWVAEQCLDFLTGKKKKIANTILQDAKKHYDVFLKTKEINDSILTSAILLARLDAVFRTKGLWDDISFDVDPEDITDLRDLVRGVPEGVYHSESLCFLNPSFGFASYLVGGADADLLLDNTLIDIKTTKDPKFTRSFFNQLMGYVILHEIGRYYHLKIGKVIPKKYSELLNDETTTAFLNTKIEKIGIYYSRSRKLQTLDLKDILSENGLSFDLLKWFENEAHETYHPTVLDDVKMKKLFKWDFP